MTWKRLLRIMQSLKIVIFLRKEVWSKDFSATDIIYFSAQEEDVEKNSEFENSDILKGSKSQFLFVWSKKHFCYRHDLHRWLKKLFWRVQSLKIVLILRKEAFPSVPSHKFDLTGMKVLRRMQKLKIGTIWKKEWEAWNKWEEGEEGCYEVVDRGGCWNLIIRIINSQT